jgi:hypothetical protein
MPLIMWNGRYVCSACNVIGYRSIVTADVVGLEVVTPNRKRVETILPYLCQAADCKLGVVSRDRRKQLCPEHKKLNDLREQARRKKKNLQREAVDLEYGKAQQAQRELDAEEERAREARKARLRAKGFKLPGDAPEKP